MPTFVPPKKNTAYTFYLGLVSQADTKIMQANPTLAAGDFKVAVDDAAPANLGTLPVVDADFTKRVKVVLSAAEMNGDNITVIASDAAGAEWCDVEINVQTSARQVDDLAYPATSGRSMVVDAAGLVDANMVKAGPTGAGTAQTAGDIIARLPAALVAGRIDASVGAMAAGAVDEIWDEIMEGTTTARQSARLANSANGAKLNGAATTTVNIRDLADLKNRVVATVDANGNRSAVTLDLT